MVVPTRPALRYFGGKWSIADWIIGYLPAHECYVEPYGGSAAVLLRKPPATFEVYNDLDSAVVTFFRVLRRQPDELIRAINCTPWSREELAVSYADDAPDDLERARRLYVQLWQAWHGHGHEQTSGWRYQRAAIARSTKYVIREWNQTAHLSAIAARLKLVQIEHDTAINVIQRYDHPGAVFYVDPPYVHVTRKRSDRRAGSYKHEMDDADHRALAEALHACRGAVLLSGYTSPLYAELYGDWERVERVAIDNAGNRRTESLWLNPAAITGQAQPASLAMARSGRRCDVVARPFTYLSLFSGYGGLEPYTTWTPTLTQGTVVYDVSIDVTEIRNTGHEYIGGAVFAVSGIASGTYPAGATGAALYVGGFPAPSAAAGSLAWADATIGLAGGTDRRRVFGMWAEYLTGNREFFFRENGSDLAFTELVDVGDAIHIHFRYRSSPLV